MKRIILMAATCLVAAQALASDWKFLHLEPAGNTYVDISSIKYRKNLVQFTLRQVSPSNDTRISYLGDCSLHTVAFLRSVEGRPDGSAIKSSPDFIPLKPQPNSPMRADLDFVCHFMHSHPNSTSQKAI